MTGERLVYADAHCHTNPVTGMGARRIARKFRSVGGWFIALVGLPPYHYGIEPVGPESYAKAFDIVIREASVLREEGLETRVLLGFHPAEVDYLFKKGMGLDEIIGLAEKVLDHIVMLHRQGLVDGIGEVGRPHYGTAAPRHVASELIMLMAMERARDEDMIMHLHLEQGGLVTVESIRRLSELVGLGRDHVFLHHVGAAEGVHAEKQGFWHTIPAKQRVMRRLLSSRPRYALIESDFIDDPRRPGVSSYPWDIAARIEELLGENIVSEDYVWELMVDHVRKAYRL